MPEQIHKADPPRRKVLWKVVPAVVIAGVFLVVWFAAKGKGIRNVLLISIDTCRADYLSCYGYPRQTTPNIDKVADDGIIFTHAASAIPLTLPSHGTMLLGTIPLYHAVRDNLGYVFDDESNITLAEVLRERGYMTGAIVSSFVLDSDFGLAQGFETYNDEFVEPLPSFYQNERRGGEASEFACKWLAEYGSKPFFLFLHYYDPHQAYQPPEPFATSYKDNLYAGEIAYVDYCIGQVVGKLKELGLYDNTLLIITADHGEALGEHVETTHGYFVYQSTIRVPFVMKIPGGPRGSRVDDLVGLVDIVPTVCSALGVDCPLAVVGKDMLGLVNGEVGRDSESTFVYCESLTPTIYGCSPLYGLLSDKWKYIHAPEPELYDLENDPDEANNLAKNDAKRLRFLRDNLKSIFDTQSRSQLDSTKVKLDDETARRLESLGYIGGGGGFEDVGFDAGGTDPKDVIGLHVKVVNMYGLLRAELISDAEEICRQIVSAYPDFFLVEYLQGKIAAAKENDDKTIMYISQFFERVLGGEGEVAGIKADVQCDRNFLTRCICAAHNDMGTAYQRKAEYGRAAEHYRQVLEIEPSYAETHFNLGSAYMKDGQFDKAIESYTKVVELDPVLVEARQYLANTLLRQGRFDEAIEQYVEALKLKGDLQECRNNLAAARRASQDILSLKSDPNQPGIHAGLGVLYHRLGNMERTVYHWGKALELGSDRADVYNNLAWVKASCEDERFFDAQEAVRLAEKACELSDYNNPGYLDTLGVAYGATGRYSDAIETAERAIDLARAQGGEQLAAEIAKHLECYRQGRAYRE